MLRRAVVVGAPLWVGLSVGGIAGIGAAALIEALGVPLSVSQKAVPVAVLVVLFGFRGAVESANRLAALLAGRGDALRPTRR